MGFFVEKTCAACGARSQFETWAMMQLGGAPDLDLRPPGTQRSYVHLEVRRCPSCGVCALDLEDLPATTRGLAESAQYRSILASAERPELVNRCLAAAYLAKAQGRPLEAAELTLRAAWAADDQSQDALARSCRLQAATLFLSDPAPWGEEEMECVMIDIYRRAGAFSEAMAMCDRALQLDHPTVQQVVRLQRRLTDAGDTTQHTVAELQEI